MDFGDEQGLMGEDLLEKGLGLVGFGEGRWRKGREHRGFALCLRVLGDERRAWGDAPCVKVNGFIEKGED